jgi:hypothetical protein
MPGAYRAISGATTSVKSQMESGKCAFLNHLSGQKIGMISSVTAMTQIVRIPPTRT